MGTTIDVFPYNITVEGVLAWPVFSSEFEDHTDLKSLLQDHDRAFPLPAATLSVVDFEAFDGDRLVRNFFDNAHVFNPVLEEGKIHDYIREARFSGLGWDAKSCLLVSAGNIRKQIKIADLCSCWSTLSASSWNHLTTIMAPPLLSPRFRKPFRKQSTVSLLPRSAWVFCCPGRALLRLNASSLREST